MNPYWFPCLFIACLKVYFWPLLNEYKADKIKVQQVENTQVYSMGKKKSGLTKPLHGYFTISYFFLPFSGKVSAPSSNGLIFGNDLKHNHSETRWGRLQW